MKVAKRVLSDLNFRPGGDPSASGIGADDLDDQRAVVGIERVMGGNPLSREAAERGEAKGAKAGSKVAPVQSSTTEGRGMRIGAGDERFPGEGR